MMLRLLSFFIAVASISLLGGGCSRGSAEAGRAESVDMTDLTLVSYRVQGMHCDGCAQLITQRFEKVDGVVEANVSYADRTATLAVSKTVHAEALRAALGDLPYALEPIDEADGKPAADSGDAAADH